MKTELLTDSRDVHPDLWKAGDIVTRDGTDEHRINYFSWDRSMMEVECVKAPSQPWTEVGLPEWNLTRRYEFVRAGR